jgi:sphingomyelin phosphodiesterase
MKLSSALLWCLPALTLTSAAAIDNRDLASTILKEFESAASCAGCEVRLFQRFNVQRGL